MHCSVNYSLPLLRISLPRGHGRPSLGAFARLRPRKIASLPGEHGESLPVTKSPASGCFANAASDRAADGRSRARSLVQAASSNPLPHRARCPSRVQDRPSSMLRCPTSGRLATNPSRQCEISKVPRLQESSGATRTHCHRAALRCKAMDARRSMPDDGRSTMDDPRAPSNQSIEERCRPAGTSGRRLRAHARGRRPEPARSCSCESPPLPRGEARASCASLCGPPSRASMVGR